MYNSPIGELRKAAKMATLKQARISHTWYMSDKNPGKVTNKTSTTEHYVAAADAAAYIAAADDAARAATEVGALIAAENALSLGVTLKVEVTTAFTDSLAFPPGAEDMVYAFDKIGTSFRADGESYVSSIPGRVKDNAVVGISADGININIDGPGATDEVLAYIEAFNTVVLSEEGAAVTITGMNVRS